MRPRVYRSADLQFHPLWCGGHRHAGQGFHSNGQRWWIRLHEKGGKCHEPPAHHNLDAWLHEYVETAGIAWERKSPLFRSANDRAGVLSERPLLARNALDLVQWRARQTGITAYLENADPSLENQPGPLG